MTAGLRTCLWMAQGGLEAAEFYVSLIAGSAILGTSRFDPDGPPLIIEFQLGGVPYMILNGSPQFKLSEAVSISVLTEDQAETDRLWKALIADGGQERDCGWLIDRWGLAWQITPRAVMEMNFSDDPAASERARQAMYKMKKLDIAVMQAAFDGA